MKLIYSLYLICIAIPLLVVITIFVSLSIILCSCLGLGGWGGDVFGSFWGWSFCRLLLLPVRVEGRERIDKHTSYVFVANHQGAFDIFLIYGFLRRNFKWMMKKSLRKNPFIGKASESAGHIFVDRSGPKAIFNTINQARKVLKNGVSLVVFPEGSRSFTGHMGYFKRGAFQLADELQMPVVPLTIDGSFDVFSRCSKWPTWHPLRLTIHDPIPPLSKGAENIKTTMEKAYYAIESALPEKYKGQVENPDQ